MLNSTGILNVQFAGVHLQRKQGSKTETSSGGAFQQIMPTIRLVVCVQLLGNAIGKQWHYSNLIEINKFA